jgi:hypothetical protein
MNVTGKLKRLLVVALILFMVATSAGAVNPVKAQPTVYQYANGIMPPDSLLPLFQVITPDVTGAGTLDLSMSLSGIYSRTNPPPQEDGYRGIRRFSILNQTNGTLMEQYGATGGFYAFNPSRAFGIGNPAPQLNPATAQLLACQLMLNNPALITLANNLQIPGLAVQCDHDFNLDPLYQVSIETLSGQSVVQGKAPDADVALRIQVTVPISIDVGIGAPLYIPLGGPGGHISMIFDDTSAGSQNPSLDDSVVGLQALAMPAFGRLFNPVKLLPAVDPMVAKDQVLSQVKAAFPDATNIVIPDPALEYFVTDAGTPQTAMEPVLSFMGISLITGGETLVLKELILPGAEAGPGGLGPTPAINSPANGATFVAGIPVTLQGSISDGTAPYIYDWQLDDGTSLMAAPGSLPGAGSLPPLSVAIPEPDLKNSFNTQTVHLVVIDNDGITREALVTLETPQLYLPFLSKAATLVLDAAVFNPAVQQPAPLLASRNAPLGNYSFGVEYGSDYPPYGPGGSDLGGVPPDANGLSAGLSSLGWPRIFNWYNQTAWEKDWRDCSLGGGDCTYGVDRADYVYYSGHGSNGTLYMPSNNHDSSWVNALNARFQNARWIGFSSCLTLRAQGTPGAEPIRNWFNSFQGTHILMGFNSVMADIAFGPRLVDNMRLPSFFGIEFPWAQRTIAEAWVQTAFEMNAGKPAYLWATSASVNPIGNKLPKVTDPLLPRPVPVNWYYWVWWNE